MGDGGGEAGGGSAWPAAAVAIAIVVVLGLLGGAAILRYAAADALQIWAGLTGALGAVIGAIGTYFFTRETVRTAQDQAAAAVSAAALQEERASLAFRALTQTAGHLEPERWAHLKETDPAVQMAVAGERSGPAGR